MTFGKNVEYCLVWLSSNVSKQKSPTAEIRYISAVGLFCLDEFEDNQTRKCSTFFPNVIVH